MAVDIKKGENMLFVGEDELDPQAKMVFETDAEGDYVVTHTEVSSDMDGEGETQDYTALLLYKECHGE